MITLLVCLFSIVNLIQNAVLLIYADPGYLDPNSPATKAGIELAIANQLSQSRQLAFLHN